MSWHQSIRGGGIHHFVVFLVKSLIFSCVFWLCWLLFFRDFVAGSSQKSVMAAEYTAESEQYQKQLKESARQLDVGAGQQIPLNNILTQQEVNAKRHSALLDIWEKNVYRCPASKKNK